METRFDASCRPLMRKGFSIARHPRAACPRPDRRSSRARADHCTWHQSGSLLRHEHRHAHVAQAFHQRRGADATILRHAVDGRLQVFALGAWTHFSCHKCSNTRGCRVRGVLSRCLRLRPGLGRRRRSMCAMPLLTVSLAAVHAWRKPSVFY